MWSAAGAHPAAALEHAERDGEPLAGTLRGMAQMDATDKVVGEMAEDEAFDIANRNTRR